MLDKLKNIFNTVISDSDANLDLVTENTKLNEDLGFNSIAMLMMAMMIEEEFGISLDGVKPEDVETVGTLMHYIADAQNKS